MNRLALSALFATTIATLGAAAAPLAPMEITEVAVSSARPSAPAPSIDPGCPAGTLPDGNVCVHQPGADDDAIDAPIAANLHRERSGRWTMYDQIPRRPERSADYDAYRYPILPGVPGGHSVVSGYDLDRPDDGQRRGRTMRAIGHGGVDLPQTRGTPVRMITLEHQQGDADIVFVGPLFGTTIVTRHTLREGGQLRDYLLLFGHLDGAAPSILAGQTVKDGDTIGFVGDTGSPELVHLHLEARRVRDGIDIAKRVKRGGAADLLANDATVVCDPRNVLPLK